MKNKKFLAIFAVAILVFTYSCKKEDPKPSNTFDFTITANGQALKDGDTITYNTVENGLINPQIRITKTSNSSVSTTLKVTNDANSTNTIVQICGWQGAAGQCQVIMAGESLSFTQTISDNTPQDPQIEINPLSAFSFSAKVTISLTANGITKTFYWDCKN